MTEPDKPTIIHVDPTDPPTLCPNCRLGPEYWEGGYGLAGGGIGVYTYCSGCGTIITKTQDHT